jgi:phosphoglycerate dehydrogenase-like enzyme
VFDEDAVVEALRSGQLDRAILDTFAVEPLPPTSPLWDALGCRRLSCPGSSARSK